MIRLRNIDRQRMAFSLRLSRCEHKAKREMGHEAVMHSLEREKKEELSAQERPVVQRLYIHTL